MQRILARWFKAHTVGLLCVGLALFIAPRARGTDAPTAESTDFLDGHLALGAGMSVQYDGTSTSSLGLATWTWHDDHYELAAFRFLTAQKRLGETLAEPNWVFEVSRRWR